MSPLQRFKRDRPCPVCGGHADLPQGEGRRWCGYLSDDGRYALCARAEHAGRLEQDGNADTFAHYLQGDCRCGVPRVERATARPPPGGSRDASPVRGPIETAGWASRLSCGPTGTPMGSWRAYVARRARPGGGKEIRLLLLRDGHWRREGFDRPRPLYNLPEPWERPSGGGREK